MSRPPLIAIGSYPDRDLQPMRAAQEFHLLATPADIATLPEALRAQVRAVAFRNHDAFDGNGMDLLPQLGLIANFGVGYDSIDVTAASARGIRVTNTPDVLNDDVADLAVAMLLAQSRRIVAAAAHVATGRWAAEGDFPLARKASGQRVGIVGLGRIGREIADRLAAFKMEIHYHSRAPKQVPEGWQYHADPVSLAGAVDCLVVALVGGEETRGYVSAAVLEALGPDGVLVNISRGSTIDEEAMIAALQAGRLGGAALDVFCTEPAPDPRLLAQGNVLALPHIGSATEETRRIMGELQRSNIDAFLAGEPLLTPVN
ncbi:MAG: 2-hydroxyacid dehydrogenase [Tropicimonas sp.]|uniref:2-hydroxyacid dehydrogenase n=1 Tax=Tropicimonas sp. TaxID=2067044 RepID=UPI003A8499EF